MRRAALALLLFACVATPVKAQGYSSDDLKRHMIERRGSEAAIWGTPAVNFDRMFQAMTAAHGSPRQVVITALIGN